MRDHFFDAVFANINRLPSAILLLTLPAQGNEGIDRDMEAASERGVSALEKGALDKAHTAYQFSLRAMA